MRVDSVTMAVRSRDRIAEASGAFPIFHEPHPGKATREGQAVSAVTGRNDAMPSEERGVSVKNLPNSGRKR